MKKLALLLAAMMLCLCVCTAVADTYPSRPITLVVPYAAGGTTDVYGRTLAQVLSEKLGQDIVVTNQTGASGSTGSLFAQSQPSDGYTLLMCAETMGTYRTMGTADLGYNDFTVISPVVGDPKIIVVGKNSPYNTMDELLDAIKAAPGMITMAHSGVGGSGYNQGLVLGTFGYNVTMITSDGGNGALMDVISGQVDFTNPNISTLQSYIESGEVKPLAVFSDHRLEAFPDIPAFTEFVPEAASYVDIPYTVLTLCVKNDVPADIVATLSAAAKEAFAEDSWNTFVEEKAGDKLYQMYDNAEAANAFYDHWQSVVCWMQYDAGVAPNSPEQFGIARP